MEKIKQKRIRKTIKKHKNKQMRKVFLSLALIAIIVSATMLPEVKHRATDNLAKVQHLFLFICFIFAVLNGDLFFFNSFLYVSKSTFV